MYLHGHNTDSLAKAYKLTIKEKQLKWENKPFRLVLTCNRRLGTCEILYRVHGRALNCLQEIFSSGVTKNLGGLCQMVH